MRGAVWPSRASRGPACHPGRSGSFGGSRRRTGDAVRHASGQALPEEGSIATGRSGIEPGRSLAREETAARRPRRLAAAPAGYHRRLSEPDPNLRPYALVGRSAERARLDAFGAACGQRTEAILLRGDPGIGKTALWGYAVHAARQEGRHVLVARPSEDDLRRALGSLGELLVETGLDVDAIPEADAPARGRAVVDAIRALAASAPVLIAIDDLQWLDAESAQVLRYVLRRLDADPVGIVATIRADAPGDPLETIRVLPPGRSSSLTLGPLGLDETRSLLRPFVLGIPRPVLRRVHELSGGNPLYAIELARSLPADRWPEPADIHPPPSIGAAITTRIEALPMDVQRCLAVAAALGSVSLRALREATPDIELQAALSVARREGLLVVDGERVRFGHPLVASAAYERIEPLDRHALHERLASMARDEDERARHLARAGGGPDAEVAAELERAARRAAARGDDRLAAEFAAHALRATPDADGQARLRRALLEIEARNGAGEAARALALVDDLLAGTPRGPDRARVLVARSYIGDEDTSEAQLLEALEDAGDDDALRGEVLERLVRSGPPATPDAIARLEEAVAIAHRTGDGPLGVRSQARLAHAWAFAGAPRPDIMAMAMEAYDALGARFFPNPAAFLAKHRMWQGDLEGARAILDAADGGLGADGNELHRLQVLLDRASLACLSGDLSAAASMSRAGVEAAVDADDRWAASLFESIGAMAGIWLGEAEAAKASLRRILGEGAHRSSAQIAGRCHWLLGALSLVQGDPRRALTECSTALDVLEAAGIRHPGAEPALVDAVEAAAAADDAIVARELLGRLEARVAPLGSSWLEALAVRARTVVDLGGGAAEDAIGPLRGAIASLDSTGHRPDAARTTLVLGRVQLRAGQRTAAADTLADALARFEAMGAPLWATACRRDLERVAPGRATGVLTATEERLAGLVAEGATNKEIAIAMYLSVATVEAHLTRIYRKLDLRSRSELTRWMADRAAPEPGGRASSGVR